MPRGFLVKRHQKYNRPISEVAPIYQKVSRYSDDDRSDSSSPEHDISTSISRVPVTYNSRYLVPLIGGGGGVVHSTFRPISSERKVISPTLSSPADIFNFQRSSTEGNDVPLALIKKVPRDSEPTKLLPNFTNTTYFPLDRLIIKSAVSTTPPPKPAEKGPTSALKSSGALHYKKRVAAEILEQEEAAKKAASSVNKRLKAVRKLNFDEDKSSPVSGTIIRDADDIDDDVPGGCSVIKRGDIDASLNLVEVTEEAKAEIAKIENKIGDYVCRLCKEHYEDPFGLAQHRCSRIVHIEYRCPECDKVFNCPANLASHRRWHKPRLPPKQVITSDTEICRNSPSPDSNNSEGSGPETLYDCEYCDKKFRRQAYLRKHTQVHIKKNDLKKSESRPIFPGNSPSEKISSMDTTSGLMEFKCNFCLNVFYSCAGLARHINKHHPSSSGHLILLHNQGQ